LAWDVAVMMPLHHHNFIEASRNFILDFLHKTTIEIVKTISAHSKSTVSNFRTFKKIFISWHYPFNKLKIKDDSANDAWYVCAGIFHPKIGGSYTGWKKSFSVVFGEKKIAVTHR
jgi:hypothetical protein